MSKRAVPLDSLPSDLQKKLASKGLRQLKERAFTQEQVRGRAIDVLSEIADLTKDQRRRVLEFALKMNSV